MQRMLYNTKQALVIKVYVSAYSVTTYNFCNILYAKCTQLAYTTSARNATCMQ